MILKYEFLKSGVLKVPYDLEVLGCKWINKRKQFVLYGSSDGHDNMIDMTVTVTDDKVHTQGLFLGVFYTHGGRSHKTYVSIEGVSLVKEFGYHYPSGMLMYRIGDMWAQASNDVRTNMLDSPDVLVCPSATYFQ